MKLTELEPQFYRYETRIEEYSVIVGPAETWRERGCPSEKVTGPRQYKIPVNTIEEAQCIFFVCPLCVNKSHHRVEVTFANRGVKDEDGTHNSKGEPSRWNVSGTDYNNLTTTPSILLEGGCAWHGYITNGEVT